MIKTSYISQRFDEAAILTTLAKVAFTPDPELLEQDYAVLASLQRSSTDWDLPLTETTEKLASYDEDQISGLVNNVKGILHEMEFQRLENEDGDSIVAALFPDTNHKAVDIQMLDQQTGERWEIQLKATDDMSAISNWLDTNPDTEILVTEELAERMNLPSSGLSNEDLTIRVENFVDRMIEIENQSNESLWQYLPPLVAASTGIIIFELWRLHRSNLISFVEFKRLSLGTLGVKGAKYTAIFAALAVPGLNAYSGRS